ncbi:2-oxopent-4-enoate hydratase [Pseudomonas aeruginosa]|uniref:2-oxopent-4-enoate hydratase n=1 Tax=Pseudomonadaceae TaxID=135621 RepID=UPI001556C46B|nr:MULTISPECIES: 2-oxopent-4-enoate hydratase [Pseudomonas aeruginosa group]QKF06513.1 2-oxopent-4-enoate hydratase [Pseudomonas aeruginosa]WAG81761.1 2-oxopent-4-enoate hydratase [Pseudomonas furukawaii]HCF1525234.1 2-oxopent-4-enoate hydratase [Pseudomonas aeruginosa]
MSPALIESLGDELYTAYMECSTIAPLTSRFDNILIEDSYHIQQRFVSRRLEAGERVVGKKIGVTSPAVMQLLSVDQPDFGQMLDGMIVNSGSAISLKKLIQPKIEGEIAFLLKKEIKGPGVSAADVISATEGVMACFEIVDSRITDWKIKIQDTVADNASCGAFVLGEQLVSPRHIDLRTCGMVLEKNGETVVTGAGAATMNSPVNAVVWLANTLGKLGIPLKAGEIILSGSLGSMVPVEKGDHLHVTIGGIGSASVSFV